MMAAKMRAPKPAQITLAAAGVAVDLGEDVAEDVAYGKKMFPGAELQTSTEQLLPGPMRFDTGSRRRSRP